jgi:hypothetical protein
MKNTQNFAFATLFFLLAFAVCCFGQTTFSGQKVDWGWSGTTTNDEVVAFLEKNWKEGEQLSLQSKAEKAGLNCEFLWKVTPDQVQKALGSGSSFITGEKVDSMTLVFYPDGKGEITLYSQGKISGFVKAHTSSKRNVEFGQLSAGNYTVNLISQKRKAYELSQKASKAAGKAVNIYMPYCVGLSGEATTRGIFIHQGDLSGEKPGVNEYHGCIRVSKLVGQQFMKLLLANQTTVNVVWKQTLKG